jgi:L-amino acid N-acyltransferase YncA
LLRVSAEMRSARHEDAGAIAGIYNEGIEERIATFETTPRTAEDAARWIGEGLPFVVAELDGRVVGFARLSDYSDRAAGFVEVGVQRRHGRLDGEWKDCVLVERLIGEAA